MNQLTPFHPREREGLISGVPPSDFEDGPAYRSSRVQPQANLLLDYLRTVSRWRLGILGAALVGGLVSFSLNLGVLPVYQARTSLDIQSVNGDFLNMHDVNPTGDSASSSTESYVQTQIKLLQSTTLLDRTVARLKGAPHPRGHRPRRPHLHHPAIAATSRTATICRMTLWSMMRRVASRSNHSELLGWSRSPVTPGTQGSQRPLQCADRGVQDGRSRDAWQ